MYVYFEVFICEHVWNTQRKFKKGVSPTSVVANELDYDIAVREFKPLSRYCVYFGDNTLAKGMKLLIPPVKV